MKCFSLSLGRFSSAGQYLPSSSFLPSCWAVTIYVNSWADAGHAVNQMYDILYMMGRDDITVGVGGEGGILEDSTIQPNIGGYLPLIELGVGTAGYCRYRQAIPVGFGGRLDRYTNYGFRKILLPQPTAPQVMIDNIYWSHYCV